MAINNTGSRRLLVTLTALFAALCGLYLLIGGGWLVAIGGSWYYPIAGLVMLADRIGGVIGDFVKGLLPAGLDERQERANLLERKTAEFQVLDD